MPSTYSTNLKLELMATGEKNNLWGGITNTNLGSLIEEAIVGAATVAMADANQAITITNGASSTGRCVYIKCTGALTAGRNLTVPTVNKDYIVENATTGGFDVTVKTAAGTGIAVKPSTKRAVYADATNVVEAISGFGALTATTVNGLTVTTSTGTLTVASGKTFTSSNTITLVGTDATSYNLDTIVAASPPGLVFPYAGSTEPTGFLLCNGQSVLRATYAALFAVISTTYGSVDGTHFNVPDMRGRVAAGSDSMGVSAAGRLTATTMTPDGTSLNSVGGTQTNTASTSSSGSNAINFGAGWQGQTSGAWSGSSPAASGANFDALTTASASNITITQPINANFNIAVSGVSSAFSDVQPTIILNYLIKT